jgi:hypothetical protein
MKAKRLLLRLFDFVAPARRLQVLSGDSLPPRLPFRALVLARDDDEGSGPGPERSPILDPFSVVA